MERPPTLQVQSADVSKVMRIYCPSLPGYSPVLHVSLGTAVVLPLIKGCVHRAHRVDLQTKVRQIYVSNVRLVNMALILLQHRPCHAHHVNQELTHLRRGLASAYHVPPAVPALNTELLSTHRARLADTTALRIKLSVWLALPGSMDRRMDQPYVLIVH